MFIDTSNVGLGVGFFLFGVGIGVVFGAGGYWVLQQIADKTGFGKGRFLPRR